ncbi:MAG: DUF4249 domain-containing protein [Bacteroidetes bacterium]|nr:MAG: DUF4249 domain-containing protein [Bacteroidota bacterium]
MRHLIFLTALSTVIFSCQKVIDVDLNEANPVVVIEGNYSAEDSTVRVRITQTSNYFDNNVSPELNNALVQIIDQSGTSTNVPFISNGNYTLTGYVPQFNSIYSLSVTVDGKTYVADCKLIAPVTLEPVTYEFFEGFFGAEGGYAPFLNFNDPAGVSNFYSIVLSRNDTTYNTLDDFFTQDDQLTDGNLVERPLFPSNLYKLGDSVHMELRSIDKRIYDYINEAQSISGGQSSAAPGNPTNNWNNGALGYFSAYSSSRQSVIIQ